MRGQREVQWTCPHCKAPNIDVPELTATPICGECEVETEWNDIPESAGVSQ